MRVLNTLFQEDLKSQEEKEKSFLEYEETLKELEGVQENFDNLVNLDLRKLNEMVGNVATNDRIEVVEDVQTLLMANINEDLGFEILDSQRETVNKVIDELKKSFMELIRDAQEEREILHMKIMSDKHFLQKLNDSSSEMINESEFDFIIKELEKLPIEERIEVLYEVLEFNCNHKENTITEEISMPVETNLSVDSVMNLLKEYSISIDDIYNVEDTIMKFGDLITMRGILEMLKSNNLLNNIDVSSSSFSQILAFSSPELVLKQIEFANKNGISFKLLMNHVTNFISDKKAIDNEIVRRVRKRKKKVSNLEIETAPEDKSPISNLSVNDDSDEIIIGTAENFAKNVEYLKEFGFDLKEIMRTTPTILSSKHQLLVNGFENLMIYRFDLINDGRSLSALGKGNFERLIDNYIELGMYDYVKNNTSFLVNYSNRMLKNIYYTIRNNDELYNSHGLIGDIRKKEVFPKNPEDIIIEDLDQKYLEDNIPISLLYPMVSKAVTSEAGESTTDPVIKELEKAKSDNNPFAYKINENLYVSRLKVLRIYNELRKNPDIELEKGLLFALTYNSLLSEKEYAELKDLAHYLAQVKGGDSNGISKKI